MTQMQLTLEILLTDFAIMGLLAAGTVAAGIGLSTLAEWVKTRQRAFWRV